MKADQSLSSIIRRLKPVSHLPWRFPRFRPPSQIATFQKSAYSQRPALSQQHPIRSLQNRFNTTSATASPSSVSTSSSELPRVPQGPPSYELTFTCKPCHHRSTHRVTKQGYHHGTVLIRCPSCKNLHVFADHLKIFADKSFTIEDLMREKGGMVKRGTLGGNMEFWDDGTQSKRQQA